MGRISSISREGPLEMAPTQPTAFIAAVMLPPASPILPAISGGNFCWKTKIDGFLEASSASITSMNDRREKLGSGRPYTQVTAYPTMGPSSGYMQRIDWSVYQFSVQGLYSPRQTGFPGYVATTFVMDGVSNSRNCSSISFSVNSVICYLLMRLNPGLVEPCE